MDPYEYTDMMALVTEDIDTMVHSSHFLSKD
jgi:hypothetical protein